jgi:hypothetical protein
VPAQDPAESHALEAVLTSILRAMQEAKLLADLEAVRAAELYRTQSGLSGLEAVSYAISEVEIELKFAFAHPVTGKTGPRVIIASRSLGDVSSAHIQTMRIKIASSPLTVATDDKTS